MAWIKSIVNELVKKHGSISPYNLANKMNINVFTHDLHIEIRGYYKYDRRNKYIVINDKLDEETQRVVCAHELGHAVLHPRSNTTFMKQNTLLSIDRIESEANRFAAELLIPDNTLAEHGHLTIFEIASLHNVPTELVMLKCKELF